MLSRFGSKSVGKRRRQMILCRERFNFQPHVCSLWGATVSIPSMYNDLCIIYVYKTLCCIYSCFTALAYTTYGFGPACANLSEATGAVRSLAFAFRRTVWVTTSTTISSTADEIRLIANMSLWSLASRWTKLRYVVLRLNWSGSYKQRLN